jgi:hypothetical protein
VPQVADLRGLMVAKRLRQTGTQACAHATETSAYGFGCRCISFRGCFFGLAFNFTRILCVARCAAGEYNGPLTRSVKWRLERSANLSKGDCEQ